MDINKVILIGRLTKDPEIQTSKSGTSFSRFSIAVNGFKKDEVSFINCISFGKTAEIISGYALKGHRIAIEGELKQNTWTDKDGNKRNDISVNVSSCQLLEKKAGTSTPPVTTNGEDDDTPF
jgi:single-strand DNA-binding protein